MKTNRSNSSNSDDGDDDSSSALPPGVVDLYCDHGGDEFDSVVAATTTSAAFESPTILRGSKQHSPPQQQQSRSRHASSRCEYRGRPMTMAMSMGGSLLSDYSTTNAKSMTIEFIRTYGQDYWEALHASERSIIYDPSMSMATSNKDKNTNANANANTDDASLKKINLKNKGSNPFGSPATSKSSSSMSSSSSSSSSSVSISSGAMTKVTPVKKQQRNAFPVKEDWNKDKKKKAQYLESTKLMSVQPQLTPKMRSILVDWLIELSEHFSFGPTTLHLAVTMVDRVLASGQFLQNSSNNSVSSNSNSNNSVNASVSGSGSGSLGSSTERRPRAHLGTLPSEESVSLSGFTTGTKESSHNSYDTDFYGDNDDDDDDDDDDDTKSKDTRCYLIPRDRFQLLGATCVWLACKVQEITPPKAKEIAYVSDHIYSIEQIKTMERRVCNALNFTFFEAPTPHHFLFEFMRASLAQEQVVQMSSALNDTCSCGCRRCAIPAAAMGVGLATNSVFRDMSHYLLELGRLPYGPTGRKPSLLAAAAVYLARVTLGIPRAAEAAATATADCDDSDSDCSSVLDPLQYYWTPTLEHYTGYTQSDLLETVEEIHKYHMAAETSSLKAVFNKYKSKKYHRVALKTVVRKDKLGFF